MKYFKEIAQNVSIPVCIILFGTQVMKQHIASDSALRAATIFMVYIIITISCNAQYSRFVTVSQPATASHRLGVTWNCVQGQGDYREDEHKWRKD